MKFDYELEIPDSTLLQTLNETKNYLTKHFDHLNITLGEYQKHARGDVELPVGGLVDMIAESSSTKYKDGRVKIDKGDSYIMLVRFGEDLPEIETVLPYGISNQPNSTHYTDQMNMYVNHERKKMTLEKEAIYETALKIYHPE